MRGLPAPHFPLEARVFNDDLLTNAGDLEYAKEQFPEIFPLLDNPTLRGVFAEYEERANKAKSRVRLLGLLAIFFGVAALLSAATEPLWAHIRYARSFVIIFEVCGVIAALVAGGSVSLGPWRKRWLESRFMTERLRQWHFQLFVRRAEPIEAAFENGDRESWKRFRTQRESWLNDFLHDYATKLDSRMESLAHDPEVANEWLHDGPETFEDRSAVLPALFDAYRRLRLGHQYDYVTHMLAPAHEHSFYEVSKWPLLRQEAFLGGAISSCFSATLICAFGVISNRLLQLRPALDPLLASLTLVIAITGVALRTIKDGLGVTPEIERYRDYRGKIRRMLLQYDAARDQQTRLLVMEELELAAVDELRGFLRTHLDAHFIL
jgi:hypothetical protein